MPLFGNEETQEAEDLFNFDLQSAATVDGNGAYADVAGLNGPQTLELNNSAAGTTSVTIEGSFDGITWYACGFEQLDATANPSRSVSPIAVTGNPFAHVYAILDPYSRIRARMSASSSAPAPSLTATLRATGV